VTFCREMTEKPPLTITPLSLHSGPSTHPVVQTSAVSGEGLPPPALSYTSFWHHPPPLVPPSPPYTSQPPLSLPFALLPRSSLLSFSPAPPPSPQPPTTSNPSLLPSNFYLSSTTLLVSTSPFPPPSFPPPPTLTSCTPYLFHHSLSYSPFLFPTPPFSFTNPPTPKPQQTSGACPSLSIAPPAISQRPEPPRARPLLVGDPSRNDTELTP